MNHSQTPPPPLPEKIGSEKSEHKEETEAFLAEEALKHPASSEVPIHAPTPIVRPPVLLPFVAGVLGGGLILCGVFAALSFGLMPMNAFFPVVPPSPMPSSSETPSFPEKLPPEDSVSMRKELESLMQRLEGVEQGTIQALETLNESVLQNATRFQALEERVQHVFEAVTPLKKLEEKLQRQEKFLLTLSQIQETEGKELRTQQAQISRQNALLRESIIVRIRRRVDQERVPLSEVALLEELDPSPHMKNTVTRLKALLRQGVPSRSALLKGFLEQDQNVGSAQGSSPTAFSEKGFWEKFLKRLGALVQITTSPSLPLDSQGSLESAEPRERIGKALRHEKFEVALEAYEALPPSLRDAQHVWGEQLRKRVAFERFLNTLSTPTRNSDSSES